MTSYFRVLLKVFVKWKEDIYVCTKYKITTIVIFDVMPRALSLGFDCINGLVVKDLQIPKGLTRFDGF